nr:hypothetical protein [Tanacetum cinerariifolium]
MVRANQDNSPRINRGTRYNNQRIVNVAGARETVEVTLDAAINSGPIFDSEPLQKVSNNDNYNVFAIESEHPEQSLSVSNTYLIEQDEHNVIIDSLDMSYDREQIDQDDDDDDLANERDLLASLIEKLKCEIDDSKIQSSNNRFKEANNELSKTNQLMYKDLKKFQAELDRRNDVKYASKVEIDCVKAKGDLMSYKMESEKSFNEYTRKINDLNQTISEMKKELFAHQETISIMSKQKEAQIVTPYDSDNSGPIFNSEPLQKVSNNDNYNGFAIKSEHPEQSKFFNDTYPIEQDEHNMIINSLDMSYDKEHVDQDDNDDLANENDLLASLIEKLKYKIDDNKNRNKFLETSNKVLVDKLQGQIEDFKTKNKSLESLNNHFKEANNELSKTNQLMYKDLKKFQAELDKYHDVKPQLKSNQIKDRVMLINSQGKKQEVEDHRRNVKFSKNKTSVTACNDSLNAKTSNVNFVCVTCGKYVLNDKHDLCVLHSLNGVNSRTKMPMDVPVSTRKPKRIINQSVATPLRKIVASESTN